MKALQILLASGLVLGGAAHSYAAAFTNGSFEGTGFVGSLGFMNLTTGSTLIPGWTVVNNIDWLTTWVAPFDGTKSIDLNGTDAGAIQQVFDTVPGQDYLVQFALAGNIVDPPSLKVGEVSAAGESEQFQFDVTGHTAASPGWVETDFSFTANDTSTTLLFQSLNPSSAGGPIIDDVRVSAVPEPASLSMISVAGLLMLRRRRIQK